MKSSLGHAAFAALMVACLHGQAMAATSLVSSAPDANASVAEAPQQIDLQFSENVALERTRITVTGPKGRLNATVGLDQNDKTHVFVSFWDTLGVGKYTVDWQVTSADKQAAHGSYSFNVKSP